MKKLFVITALSAASILSADYYDEQSSDQPMDMSSTSRYDNQGQQYFQPNTANYYQDKQNDPSKNQASGKQVSDDELATKIHDKISGGWFSKGFHNVSYTVNNGFVTLQGYVGTLKERNRVAEDVKNLDGVRGLNNQIRVSANEANDRNNQQQGYDQQGYNQQRGYDQQQGYNDQRQGYNDQRQSSNDKPSKYSQDYAATPQDKEINDKIRSKLSGGWFSKENETLVIRTANGIVIISGIVEKPEEAKKITDQLQDVEGVKGIRNQLQVRNTQQ